MLALDQPANLVHHFLRLGVLVRVLPNQRLGAAAARSP